MHKKKYWERGENETVGKEWKIRTKKDKKEN